MRASSWTSPGTGPSLRVPVVAALLAAALLAAALVLAVGGTSSAPGPAGSVGPAGPVGPVARACHGVRVTPGEDVHAVVRAQPPGTTFCLAAGVHRIETPVVPRRGDALIGEPGAVLSGSKVVTGWERAGARWWARGFLPPAPGSSGECEASAPTCTDAEDVFLDGRRLERAGSPEAVVPGTVHADHDLGVLVIGDDPAGRLVEQAVAPALVRAVVDDVTVENLVLEQAANEAQVAAVDSRDIGRSVAGTGWRVRHNEVRLNHGVGVGFGGRTVVEANDIHHQGQLGFGAWGAGSVVRDNRISSNGVAGYSAEWEAGGSKSWLTEDLVIVRNDVHDNHGPGLWTDGGNIRTTYEHNRIADNAGAGIQHEISYDAVIRHNEITGNGRVHKGWVWEAGIQIQSSGGVERIEVAHNLVTGGANGIVLIDSGDRADESPAPFGPHVVRNVEVNDNVVTMERGGVSGAVDDTGDPGIYTTGGNRFDDNVYRLPALDVPHFAWGGEDLTWSEWRGSGRGNDLGGTAEPVP